MKKIATAVLSMILLLGLGTGVFAKSTGMNFTDFKEMLPMMQQMHPDMDKKELKAMYDDCKIKQEKAQQAEKQATPAPETADHCKVNGEKAKTKDVIN